MAKAKQSNRKTIRFVHIADPHLDLWYDEGAIADCGAPYCCRFDVENFKGTRKAGKFGSTNGPCDPPKVTF